MVKGTFSRIVKMPAPEVEGLLEDLPGGAVNLLPVTLTYDDVKVWFTVPVLSDPSAGEETVELFVDYVDENSLPIDHRSWTAPIEDSDRFLVLPSAWLRNSSNEGEHKLSYRAMIFNGATEHSDDLVITLDITAPTLATDSHLVFPAQVLPPNQITAAYLADPANQDQVLARVPDYTEKNVGDVITWYWEKSPGGVEEAGTKTLELDDVNKDLWVSFSGDLLRRTPNTVNYFASYRIRDRAGNGGDVLSSVETLQVNIRPPIQRKFPTVKEATTTIATGVLDPFRGIAGVTVVVAPSEIDPGEAVTVDFIGLGGEEGIGSLMGVEPVNPGELEFRIPFPIVAANIPVDGDGRSAQVRYWAGRDTQHSAVYTLKINELAKDKFGKVECPEADIGQPATLSKSKVALSGAHISINKWAYHEDSQLINVWAVEGGVREDFLEGGATPITGNAKFVTPLPKSYVAALSINTTFTLYASVSFDQGNSYSAFQTMALKVVA